jgi:hypothetical protein
MIDLKDESVVAQLHKAGWRVVPDDCILIERDVLAKLLFNNMDESDKEWAKNLLEDITAYLKFMAEKGASDDGPSEHNR